MKALTAFVLLLVSASVVAQERAEWRYPLQITVFDNASLLPGSAQVAGIIGLPVHPGFSVGTERPWNHRTHNIWFQTARFALQYHRYVQTSAQLYSEFGYRHRWGTRFDAEMRLGAGYLHSIPATQVFKQTDNGAWERKRSWGRPQFMGTTAAGIGCRIAGTPEKPVRATLAYQFYLQMPFVNEYVTLLPNTALHLGMDWKW